MDTQILIVDRVRKWHTHPDNARFSTKVLECCNVTLVTNPCEYEGTEEFKAIILWDELPGGPADDSIPTSLQAEIFNIVKRFGLGINGKINQVSHDSLTTYIKFKSTKPKNVEAYEWLDLKVEDYKDVD